LPTADIASRVIYPHDFVAINSAISWHELESLASCELVPVARPIGMRQATEKMLLQFWQEIL
jgi:hypothetical protein